MQPPEFPKMNVTSQQIHNVEQNWAAANEKLDEVMTALRKDAPGVAAATGLSDPSALFDYMMAFIIRYEMMRRNHDYTIIMCAAAITRLALGPSANNELAQYESEMENPNDNH